MIRQIEWGMVHMWPESSELKGNKQHGVQRCELDTSDHALRVIQTGMKVNLIKVAQSRAVAAINFTVSNGAKVLNNS